MTRGETAWPATVFEQVNPTVGAEVRQHAVSQLLEGAVAGGVAWDLYAGIGETTRLLTEAGCQVESVELDPRAVALAEQIGPAGPRRLAGDVAQRLVRMSRPDLVITNPPRVGMADVATEGLVASGARRIAYVSCDPATLARDLGRLAGVYQMSSVTAFDQFPQTAHVECVALLERR
jgi:23S rRNA (uracil1939-C5)-methyltransferase